MTKTQDALCCALTAVADSAADAGADPFKHQYPSMALTWPYCGHHFITGRALPPSTLPPPDGVTAPASDVRTTGVVLYHRFAVDVGRCGPPMPESADQCLGDLYGDCSSPAGHTTLAGHHRAVDAELDRLMSEFLERWCDCLTATIAGYPRHAPRWIEHDLSTVETQGRFTVIRLQIGTRLG